MAMDSGHERGNGAVIEEVAAVADVPAETSSLNGFAGTAPADPLVERPELLIGAAVFGGLLLAGLVSRLGR